MKFETTANLAYEVYGPTVFLLAVRCHDAYGQEIVSEKLEIKPSTETKELRRSEGGNRYTRLDVTDAGPLSIHYEATVSTSPEVIPVSELSAGGLATHGIHQTEFLFPSRYVQTDMFRNAAMDLFGDQPGELAKAVAIEDWLHRNIRYAPGTSNEQSSAADTFVARTGVCRDFAHLGIAFCRCLNIPARYVTVFANELVPQDFHAVFEAFVGNRWLLFDGTRLAPLNGMVRIAIGHDAADVSFATVFGSVAGTLVDVAVAPAEGEEFEPIDRAALVERDAVISLATPGSK